MGKLRDYGTSLQSPPRFSSKGRFYSKQSFEFCSIDDSRTLVSLYHPVERKVCLVNREKKGCEFASVFTNGKPNLNHAFS